MLRCVYQGTGPADAYLVRDWLERNGFRTWIRGEALMSIRGELPVNESWPSVWVHGEAFERAAESVKMLDHPTLVLPDWECPDCFELNEGHFGSCWNCGVDGPL